MALKQRSQVAYEFETGSWFTPEINQRRYGAAVGEKRFARKVWNNVIGDAEAVCPDESSVFHDAPTVRDASGGEFLAMGGAAQHQPFEGQHLCTRSDLDVRFAGDAGVVEDNGFLWQPCKSGGVASFQRRQDVCGFRDGSIDLLRCLRCDRNGRFLNHCHTHFQSISSSDASRRIDKNCFLGAGASGLWEENPKRRFLIKVHDACAFFRATQYDPTTTFGSLQVFVR